MLKDRLEEVEHRIEEACRRAGRKREEGHTDRSQQGQSPWRH